MVKASFVEECKDQIFNQLINWDGFDFRDTEDFCDYVFDAVDRAIQPFVDQVDKVDQMGQLYYEDIESFWDVWKEKFDWELEAEYHPFDFQYRHDVLVNMFVQGCHDIAEDVLEQMIIDRSLMLSIKADVDKVDKIIVDDNFLINFCTALDKHNIHPFSEELISGQIEMGVNYESYRSKAQKEIEKRSVTIHRRPKEIRANKGRKK